MLNEATLIGTIIKACQDSALVPTAFDTGAPNLQVARVARTFEAESYVIKSRLAASPDSQPTYYLGDGTRFIAMTRVNLPHVDASKEALAINLDGTIALTLTKPRAPSSNGTLWQWSAGVLGATSDPTIAVPVRWVADPSFFLIGARFYTQPIPPQLTQSQQAAASTSSTSAAQASSGLMKSPSPWGTNTPSPQQLIDFAYGTIGQAEVLCTPMMIQGSQKYVFQFDWPYPVEAIFSIPPTIHNGHLRLQPLVPQQVQHLPLPFAGNHYARMSVPDPIQNPPTLFQLTFLDMNGAPVRVVNLLPIVLDAIRTNNPVHMSYAKLTNYP